MQVSVIIVNYNTRQLLCNCLRSIQERTTYIEYEVIIVDNASTDDSYEIVTRDFPWVRWIQSEENLGFGRANNLGMSVAKGKYFFLLNSDTLLVNNALKEFFDYAELNPDFGALGAILLGPDNDTCHSFGKFITPWSELKFVLVKYLRFLKDKSNLHPEKVDSPQKVDYITGADLWIPRKVYETIGGFDPIFFMYCEEVDWQQRMADANLDRLIIPGPEIIHLEGGSDNTKSRLWSPSRLKNIYTSKRIYHRKHFKKWVYPFFRIVYLLLNSPSLIMLTIVKNGGGIRK